MTRVLDCRGKELKVGDRVRWHTGTVRGIEAATVTVVFDDTSGRPHWFQAPDGRCPDLELITPNTTTETRS
jgi:hypothetical protein